MPFLIDTSALLALYQKEQGAERVAALFEQPEEKIFLCAVSIAEFGRKLRDLGVPASEILEILDLYLPMFTNIIGIDESVARISLRLVDQVTHRLPQVDSFIASAAIQCGADLVHKDKHFSAIPATVLPQVNLLSLASQGK